MYPGIQGMGVCYTQACAFTGDEDGAGSAAADFFDANNRPGAIAVLQELPGIDDVAPSHFIFRDR